MNTYNHSTKIKHNLENMSGHEVYVLIEKFINSHNLSKHIMLMFICKSLLTMPAYYVFKKQ